MPSQELSCPVPSPLFCVVSVFSSQRAQCQVGSLNRNFGRISAIGVRSASTAMPSATDHHLHKMTCHRPISFVATALPVHQPQIDRKEGVAGQKAFTIADLVSKSQERGRRTRIQRRKKKGRSQHHRLIMRGGVSWNKPPSPPPLTHLFSLSLRLPSHDKTTLLAAPTLVTTIVASERRRGWAPTQGLLSPALFPSSGAPSGVELLTNATRRGTSVGDSSNMASKRPHPRVSSQSSKFLQGKVRWSRS